MSLRIDTSELIAGALVIGNTGLGVLGSDVPATGEAGASYLYNDLSLPADNNVEVRGQIITPPSAGTFFAWEDGSFSLTGAPDGNYTFTYRLYADGVDLGTATGTVTFGASAGALTGAVALSNSITAGALAGLTATTLLQDVQALLATLAPAGGVSYGLNTASPTAYPYIVWRRTASAPNVSLRGPSQLQSTHLQIDIYSRTVAEAAAIETALEAAFTAWSVQNVPLLSFDLVDPDTRAYRVVKEYSVWATN